MANDKPIQPARTLLPGQFETMNDAVNSINLFNPFNYGREFQPTPHTKTITESVVGPKDLNWMEIASQIIQEDEGFKGKAYRLGNEGNLTIGFGHNSKNVKEGMVWTREQATQALKKDLEEVGKYLQGLPGFDNLNPYQKSVLGGYFYQNGINALNEKDKQGQYKKKMMRSAVEKMAKGDLSGFVPALQGFHLTPVPGEKDVRAAGVKARMERNVKRWNTTVPNETKKVSKDVIDYWTLDDLEDKPKLATPGSKAKK